jgi:hypothetical protein
MKSVLLFSLLVSFGSGASDFVVTTQKISEGNRFQAISIDEKGGLWVSGTNSAVYHSTDSGESWTAVNTPNTSKPLQFRDIQVVNDTIILMSAGEGADSKLYMSKNAGESWILTNQGKNPSTFYDCFSMLDDSTGWLYGDSVNEKFSMLKTTDGAKSWKAVTLPFAAQEDEGGFASSGTCLNHNAQGDIAIGTGNAEIPRLLIKKADQAWQSIPSPYAGGEAAGIFTVQFDDSNLYTFGGSLTAKAKNAPAAGYKYSLTKSKWMPLPVSPFNGAVYGSAITEKHVLITSPQGIAVMNKSEKYTETSYEDASASRTKSSSQNLLKDKLSWKKISDLDIWAIACSGTQCWGVGANDVVVTISW